MKRIVLLSLLLFFAVVVNAQNKKVDTLYVKLKRADSDTARITALLALSKQYYISYPDSSIVFGQQAYELAEKYKWISLEGRSLNDIANAYATIGDYVKGMQFYFKALRTYENINDLTGISSANNNIGATYIQKEDYKSAFPYLRQAEKQLNAYALSHKLLVRDKQLKAIILDNIGEDYLDVHKIDSAEYYLKICYQECQAINFEDIKGAIQRALGEVEVVRENKAAALKYFRNAVKGALSIDDVENLSIAYLSTANLYHKYKQQDSAEFYARKALETARAGKYEQDVLNAGKVLYKYYDEDNNLPEAYKYFKLTTAAKDSIYSQDKVKQLLSMDFEEKQRQRDIIAARVQYRDQVRTYAFIAGLAISLLLVFIFWRNSRQNKRAKTQIQNTLDELKMTQQQLIQSEKMASLGELTAGIAHEIQNPLNFVNNFSEVNTELIDEMQHEIEQGHFDEVKEIAVYIRENQEKINQHGKRADGIVKGMLHHSRAGSGQKEPTDINALADEYLRLTYHGLRAKDKSFNAEMVADFDENIEKINVNPQDIGRVILNLLTNAFYSVNEKKKIQPDGYVPTVTISTKRVNLPGGGGVEISISDNGLGIPQNVLDKIYQPFFTTKPTGQGTGLGLSMSYDIIKAHNGELKAETQEGEYTQFVIAIPV